MLFSDFAGEECGSCDDDDESDVDELDWIFCRVGRVVGHVRVLVDGCEHVTVMDLAWLYVVVSSAALAEVRVWGVMAP